MSIAIDTANRIAVITVVGRLDATRFEDYCRDLIGTSGFQPNMHALWDLRQVQMQDIPVSEFNKAAEVLQRYRTERGESYRSALVVKDPINVAATRVYAAITSLAQRELAVFEYMDEALAWLRSDPSATSDSADT